MSKNPLPFGVNDIGAFARSVRKSLDGLERSPSHVEMLNLLARAGGFRNFQHFKAQHEAGTSLQTFPPVQAEVDYRLVKQLVRLFDDNGRLVRWPKKFTLRMFCLWALWSRFPARTSMTEREISDWLQERHCFGDHALLRRELVDRRLVTRTPDGRVYTRIEQRPPAEAAALFEQLRK
ncbi:hypothetical protein SAMN05660653_01708 [Desulfonatronum thiosulfatophilum]|uniref:DUF2087 domain-containing protein n=1 Tax=Desulfonatronum thiosulfatophilum TaxID=617002 RepID=A0A1G6CTQ2_9BACT|nr:DUF2087 domain-containing protein [Desulfonatronum thiosulfatophilum]SDB36231.1 hypothetical protein SAMN05660653_01708 [Desulfonatronum thiosulfatophilum]